MVAVALTLALALALMAGAACSPGPLDPEPTTGSSTGGTSIVTEESAPDVDPDDGHEAGGAPDDPQPPEVAPVAWAACGDGLECGTVTAPLDHGEPQGPTIEVALIRRPATDPSRSTRSILVNPGGPGGSGVDFLRAGFQLDPTTMADHHLVGFDPRGIGASSALRCGDDDGVETRPDFAPDDRAERQALDEAAQDLAERCQALDGDLLPHLSTESVVADLELIRQALGESDLRYLGFSYGTYIGFRYAARFPDRVGRMVLDGVVDPDQTLVGLLAQQAEGFDRVLGALDEACGTDVSCPSGGVSAAYDRAAARLDADGPIGSVGSTELAIGTLVALYAEALWPRLAAALDDADRGDLEGIGALADLYDATADVAAYHAVICTDGPVPVGADGWDRLEDRLAAISPRFGAVLANEVRACAHWPVRSTAVPDVADLATLPPILVLSTTGDAATPVENAVEVAARLPGAALVTLDDTSHTAYGRSFCVTEIVADYLATGDVPTGVHRC